MSFITLAFVTGESLVVVISGHGIYRATNNFTLDIYRCHQRSASIGRQQLSFARPLIAAVVAVNYLRASNNFPPFTMG
jgi:hypothetical protein